MNIFSFLRRRKPIPEPWAKYYTKEELMLIVIRGASILGVDIENEGAEEIALRARGTPRIANALLRRVRDFAEIKSNGEIEIGITKFALDSLNVDEYGLDDMDNKIMRVMIENFRGKPVGISALATSIGENPETLEEVYEPFLIQEGFIIRTPRGREVTEKAYKHLNIKIPKKPGELF
jgi:Holliday junction DNA helicase RuvB